MVNKVTLIGNLGRAPELFHTQSGQPVARLSIATNKVWTKNGERQRRTEWHRVMVWGLQPNALRRNCTRAGSSMSKAESARAPSRTPTTRSRRARRSTRTG